MRVFSMELKVNLIKTLVSHITVEDEVSFTSKYYLIATINHSGSLNRGHYWTFIKDIHSSSWYSCNDKLVFNFEESSPSNTTQYILFYSMFPRIHQKFSWCCKGFLSFQTLSLGVATHNIPQSCAGIEFSCSFFRLYNPAVLSFGEVMQVGSIKHGLIYEEWRTHI